MVVNDAEEFFNRFAQEIIDIFNLGLKNTQSIGIDLPMDVTQFLSEGTVVTLTDIDGYKYVGIIENMDGPSDSERLDEEEQLLTIDVFYKYDKSSDPAPTHTTVEEEDVICEVDKEPVKLRVEKFGSTIVNKDIDVDILCVVSDQYLSETMGDNPMRVSHKI
jgi:hypothetical protein